MLRTEKDETKGVVVFRREDEDIDSLIKRFKRKVNKSGLLRELKVKNFYEKPSVFRKRKQNEAQTRRLRDLAKLEKLEKSRKRGKQYDSSNK